MSTLNLFTKREREREKDTRKGSVLMRDTVSRDNHVCHVNRDKIVSALPIQTEKILYGKTYIFVHSMIPGRSRNHVITL